MSVTIKVLPMPFDLVKGALIYNSASTMVLTAVNRNLLITGYNTSTPTVVGKITTEQRADIDRITGTDFISTFTGNAFLLEDADVLWAYKSGMSVQREVTPGTVTGEPQVTAPITVPEVEPVTSTVSVEATATDVGATVTPQVALNPAMAVFGHTMIAPVLSSDQAAIHRDVGLIVGSQFALFPDLQYERYLKHIIKSLSNHASLRKFED